MPRSQVLGYPVDVITFDDALSAIQSQWVGEKSKNMQVVTINAEMIMQAQEDKKLDHVIREAELIVPDGAGVVMALKMDGITCNRMPGIELAQKALACAASNSEPVALLGGKPEVMEKLLEVLPKKHNGLNIVFHHHGFIQAGSEEQLVNNISKSKAKLLLVAMGVPRQEFFIKEWRSKLPSDLVVMGVGGSFDVWTGFVKRAPESYQKLNLEWLYRLKSEPWRFKRMASTLPKFALQVIFKRIFGKN